MVLRGEGGGGNRAQDWTAKLMVQPAGPWLVGGSRDLIAVGALAHLPRVEDEARRQADARQAGARGCATWIIRFGRAGYAVRGVIFCLIGAFMILAARHHNPGEAKGVGEAMQHVAGMSYGWLMLGAIALGLIAYGVFQWVEARYRRIEVC